APPAANHLRIMWGGPPGPQPDPLGGFGRVWGPVGEMNASKLLRWTAVLFIVLLINTAYLASFNSPTIFYMGNVLFHFVLGVVLTLALLFLLRRFPVAAGFFLAASALGIFLAVGGNTYDHRWALVSHVVAAALGLVILTPFAL